MRFENANCWPMGDFNGEKEIFSKSSKLMCKPIVLLLVKHFNLNVTAEKQNDVCLINCKYHFDASLIYKFDLEGRSKQDIHNAHTIIDRGPTPN